MKKNIELSVETARELLENPEKAIDLIKANFTDDELNPKPKVGWYVSAGSKVLTYVIKDGSHEPNVFPYKSQAEGVLAMSQLAQKMAEVNGSWKSDWNIDWVNDEHESQIKYCIVFYSIGVQSVDLIRENQFLAFPTAEIRDKFLEENLDLIKEYGKIFRCE